MRPQEAVNELGEASVAFGRVIPFSGCFSNRVSIVSSASIPVASRRLSFPQTYHHQSYLSFALHLHIRHNVHSVFVDTEIGSRTSKISALFKPHFCLRSLLTLVGSLDPTPKYISALLC
eukprot:TRINITY_DN30_c0_g1_i1.p1 TRINITY_DN30_c0_g1~~TRINITY_DN30_c0_g1_i1.p1  ORF type:complete len:119 (-),score=9.68 TRINITY_DN30_c0_g1_i1:294-650(-)